MNRFSVLAVVAVVLAPRPVLAGGADDTIRDFYQRKQAATTPAAYGHAVTHLASISPGMGELQFLQTMDMEVLAHDGKPMDARLDGYLARSSREKNRAADKDVRYLVFGYIDSGHEVPCTVVTLRGRQVVEIRRGDARPPLQVAAQDDGQER